MNLIFDKAKTSDSIINYVDLDYAGDLGKGRYLTSYLFTFFERVIN